MPKTERSRSFRLLVSGRSAELLAEFSDELFLGLSEDELLSVLGEKRSSHICRHGAVWTGWTSGVDAWMRLIIDLSPSNVPRRLLCPSDSRLAFAFAALLSDDFRLRSHPLRERAFEALIAVRPDVVALSCMTPAQALSKTWRGDEPTPVWLFVGASPDDLLRVRHWAEHAVSGRFSPEWTLPLLAFSAKRAAPADLPLGFASALARVEPSSRRAAFDFMSYCRAALSRDYRLLASLSSFGPRAAAAFDAALFPAFADVVSVEDYSSYAASALRLISEAAARTRATPHGPATFRRAAALLAASGLPVPPDIDGPLRAAWEEATLELSSARPAESRRRTL